MKYSTRLMVAVTFLVAVGCSQNGRHQATGKKNRRNMLGVNVTKAGDSETWFIPSLKSETLELVAKRADKEAPKANWAVTVGGKQSVSQQLSTLKKVAPSKVISHLRWLDEQPTTGLLDQVRSKRLTFVNVTWTSDAWNKLSESSVASLELVNCRFGETDFSFANGFAGLRQLTLKATSCPDETLESLSGKKSLKTLALNGADSNEVAVLRLLAANPQITTACFDQSRWNDGVLNLVIEPELFTTFDETRGATDSSGGNRLLNKLGNRTLASTLAANEIAPILAEIKQLEAVRIQVVVSDPSDTEQLAAFEVIRTAVPSCEFECFAAPDAVADPEIDYYRSGPAHTGYRPDLRLSSKPVLRHRYGLINVGIHTASKSSPVVNGDQVFVGADSGFLYALDRNSLELQWTFRVRKTAHNGIHATAAVDANTVYIGGYDGWIYALDRLSGHLKWQSKVGDYIGASLVIWDDRLFAGVEIDQPNGYVACVNKATGDILFKSDKVGGHTHCTPTIHAETRTIFIGGNLNYFLALDADTGKSKWSFRSYGDIKSTAALFDGSVLFSSWDKQVYKLSQKTGKKQWAFKTEDISMSSPSIDTQERRVFVGGHDGRMYALDFATGKRIWSFQTGGAILSSATIVRNSDNDEKLVVFGSRDSFVYGLNADNGDLRFKLETQGRVTSVPVVHQDALYVSGDDGYLYVWQ